MTIYGSVTEKANRTGVWFALRWICVVPGYLTSAVITFLVVWMWVGLLTGLGDDGLSWFSILIVGLASFAGISVSALIAPKYKLIVVLLFALVTVLLVPRPYTLKTSGDGEAIPSRYELIGGVSGGLSAVATIFLRRKWNS
jgi:hypothetical protein